MKKKKRQSICFGQNMKCQVKRYGPFQISAIDTSHFVSMSSLKLQIENLGKILVKEIDRPFHPLKSGSTK